MINKAKFLIKTLMSAFKGVKFGFTRGHAWLTNEKILLIKSYIGKIDDSINSKFEREFSKLVGKGESISYASGRMGFYVLMKTLKIQEGDEVIILGSTCSVMINAILKLKAKPVFTDLDNETFGSCPISISNNITKSELKNILNPETYIGLAVQQAQLIIQDIENKRTK